MTYPKDAVSYYSDVAEKFHASYKHDANRLERMSIWKRFLDTYSGGAKTAYDIGCGSGLMACELASRGITTTGIDGADGMLKIARATAAERNYSNVHFIQRTLPVPTSEQLTEVDLVVMSSVIEYISSISDALAMVSRVLPDDGMFIFSISNKLSLSRKLVRLVHRITGRPRYFGLIKHFMTVEEISQHLASAGFRVIETDYFGRADKINRMLGLLLPASYASNMILIAARKN